MGKIKFDKTHGKTEAYEKGFLDGYFAGKEDATKEIMINLAAQLNQSVVEE